MNAGKLLSAGLLSTLLVACESGNQPAVGQAEREKVVPVINALTKSAAMQAGYGISREVVGEEPDFDIFNDEMTKQMKEAGICENFIELAKEISQSMRTDFQFNWMTSPRFLNIVSCLESNAESFGEGTNPDAVMGVIDQCICAGSGTLFGAVGFGWNGKYKSPQINQYKAPNVGTYRSPDVGGYKSPTIPGYKGPAL